jgi:hypothetical protein
MATDQDQKVGFLAFDGTATSIDPRIIGNRHPELTFVHDQVHRHGHVSQQYCADTAAVSAVLTPKTLSPKVFWVLAHYLHVPSVSLRRCRGRRR